MSQERIHDRSQEQPGSSDKGVMLYRSGANWPSSAMEKIRSTSFASHPRTRLGIDLNEVLFGAGSPPDRQYVEAGLFASYGIDQRESYRRGASYVDRILKGAKPDDLPVEMAMKFDLVINLATAKAIDLDIPITLLARADEVIE